MKRDEFDAVETARQQFEIIDQLWDSVRRRQRIVGVALGIVVFALAGTIWYAHSVVRLAPDRDSAGTSIGSLRAQLAELELSQQQDQARIASLQEQLNQAHASPSHSPVSPPQASGVEQPQAPALPPAPSPDASSNPRRIDFAVAKGHSRQLAPGISLGITRTNTANHTVDGWLWLMPDRRTVWLRGTTTRQTVVFYGQRDGKKREVVLTGILPDSVSGYLLLP